MPTHALCNIGTGGTAALAKTQIGSDIVLPAGGPWTIFGFWGQVAKITAAAAEGTGGHLIIESKSGDISPDPAPGTFPMIGSPGTSSANCHMACLGLNIWPVNWQASGKATLSLYYQNQLAITAGSATAAGIIFGDSVPDIRPLVFCDGLYTAFASATEQSVGTVTLAEKATRIVGILADVGHGDALTVAEPTLATIRLASDDIKLPPAQYPCVHCFDSGDGTVEGETAVTRANFIPVDIPVEGGARIDVYATSSHSVTGNCEVRVYIAYE